MSGRGSGQGGLALVMSGGGARAAYQVGFLHRVARECPDLHVPILTGVSAGAINAAKLATTPGNFRDKARELQATWQELSVEKVFTVDASLVRQLPESRSYSRFSRPAANRRVSCKYSLHVAIQNGMALSERDGQYCTGGRSPDAG